MHKHEDMQTIWYPHPAVLLENCISVWIFLPFCIPGVRKCAIIVFEVVIVQRVSVAVASVHALLLTGNAILTCAETAGWGMYLQNLVNLWRTLQSIRNSICIKSCIIEVCPFCPLHFYNLNCTRVVQNLPHVPVKFALKIPFYYQKFGNQVVHLISRMIANWSESTCYQLPRYKYRCDNLQKLWVTL
jgi:hypothetical protein